MRKRLSFELFSHIQFTGCTVCGPGRINPPIAISGRIGGRVSRKEPRRLSRVKVRNQPGPGGFPIPFHGDLRNAQCYGGLIFLQAGEETQFHHPGGSRIDDGESGKCLVQRQNVLIPGHRRPAIHARQTHTLPPAAALLCNSCPGVIDQNAAHGLGGNRKEVSPILIGDYLSAKKPDTEFVDQRGGL